MQNKKFYNQLVIGGAQLGMRYIGNNQIFRKKKKSKKYLN
tara:strand:+ start:254 stop:373 length:120 start_codon:yes stop_codon:yes gene_type:complete